VTRIHQISVFDSNSILLSLLVRSF